MVNEFLSYNLLDQACIQQMTRLLAHLYSAEQHLQKQFQAVVLVFCKLATEPIDQV